MLCVATFRWLCHFAESGYSVFQVLSTHILRQPYKILTDSHGSWYPPRVLFDQNLHFPYVFRHICYEVSIRSFTRHRIPKALDFTHPYGGTLFIKAIFKACEARIFYVRAYTQGDPITISEDPDRQLNSIQVFRIDVKNTVVWWKRLGRHPFRQAIVSSGEPRRTVEGSLKLQGFLT